MSNHTKASNAAAMASWPWLVPSAMVPDTARMTDAAVQKEAMTRTLIRGQRPHQQQIAGSGL